MHQNDLYVDYFKHQVMSHPEMDYQVGVNEVFRVVNVEESIGDLRSGGSTDGYLFRLIMYTYRVSRSSKQADAKKYLTGGWIIAKGHSPRTDGTNGFLQAMADAEKINDEIIEKMIADSENGHPLFYHSFNTDQQINSQPKVHATGAGYSGWLTTFQFSNWFRNCPQAGDPAWADGGLTPY